MQAEAVSTGWESQAHAQQHPYIMCSYDRNPGPRAKDCVRACGLNQCSSACEPAASSVKSSA